MGVQCNNLRRGRETSAIIKPKVVLSNVIVVIVVGVQRGGGKVQYCEVISTKPASLMINEIKIIIYEYYNQSNPL